MNNTDEKNFEAGVMPFRPYIYDVRSAGDIKNLTAPPYDVISKELQDDLYGRSEYNIVRLEFGKEEGGGDGAENKYTRAALLFNEWTAKGILKREDKDSIYIYVQKFTADNVSYERIGFLSSNTEKIGLKLALAASISLNLSSLGFESVASCP